MYEKALNIIIYNTRRKKEKKKSREKGKIEKGVFYIKK